jgi:hypothetical protein
MEAGKQAGSRFPVVLVGSLVSAPKSPSIRQRCRQFLITHILRGINDLFCRWLVRIEIFLFTSGLDWKHALDPQFLCGNGLRCTNRRDERKIRKTLTAFYERDRQYRTMSPARDDPPSLWFRSNHRNAISSLSLALRHRPRFYTAFGV